MRLINTKTKTLEEFETSDAPPYAILSHTWSCEEITYQDLTQSSGIRDGKKIGWAKFDNGCRLAAEEGYDYFWMDTCCVDKANSVELSETINSMFHWYQQAAVCYAHLADVPETSDIAVSQSRWFTRGWTLQELLAPAAVHFVTEQWAPIMTKRSSASLLETITGIPSEFLLGQDLEDASVAMRMSWASRRQTTKPEDIAYCLLGIFGIHMPLLYGEQQTGAFRRLQQEIIKQSDDQSIFAWKIPDESYAPTQDTTVKQTFSLLAPSPAAFEFSSNVFYAKAPAVSGYLEGVRTPTVFDNKGLHLALPVIQGRERRVRAILACSDMGKEKEERISITLQDVSKNGGRYIRVDRNLLTHVSMREIKESAKYANISVAKGEYRAHNAAKVSDDVDNTSSEELLAVYGSRFSRPNKQTSSTRMFRDFDDEPIDFVERRSLSSGSILSLDPDDLPGFTSSESLVSSESSGWGEPVPRTKSLFAASSFFLKRKFRRFSCCGNADEDEE